MQTAIATLRQLPETRQQVADFTEILINEALSGMAEPIQMAKMLKILEEIAVTVQKDPAVNTLIIEEVAKYGKGKHTVHGANIALKQRSTYDLTSCGDPVYDDLKTALKERETFLKALKSEMVDPANGIVISPPTVKVSEYYECTLAE